ncbi:MAG: copper chaperone [Chloroflexi bacterium]|nr:MAG: copper chaperone [Chloroflexota bacterium]
MAKKVTLKIMGMECPNCSMNLERIEDKLKGIVFAEASYRKEQMVVEYDDAILTLDQIKAEVKRLGYEVAGVI